MPDIVYLTAADLDDVMQLQQTVYDGLSDAEKNFILPKSRQHLTEIFNRGSFMMGVKHEGKLVAQAIVLNPTAAHPETGMVDMRPVGTPETTSVLQGVLVHPDSRGMRLGKILCTAWIKVCRQSGRHNVMAETALPNVHSQSIFFAHHMPMVSLGIDPSDGTIVCNHYADLHKPAPGFARAAGYGVRMDNVTLIGRLFDDGYIALRHKKHKGEDLLVLAKAPSA